QDVKQLPPRASVTSPPPAPLKCGSFLSTALKLSSRRPPQGWKEHCADALGSAVDGELGTGRGTRLRLVRCLRLSPAGRGGTHLVERQRPDAGRDRPCRDHRIG